MKEALLSTCKKCLGERYALAVMVYQWLCGKHQFQGIGLQVCLQHLSTPPPLLRDRVPSISPAVERVVLKALSKDPYQRFAHVQEFAHALKRASRLKYSTDPCILHP